GRLKVPKSLATHGGCVICSLPRDGFPSTTSVTSRRKAGSITSSPGLHGWSTCRSTCVRRQEDEVTALRIDVRGSRSHHRAPQLQTSNLKPQTSDLASMHREDHRWP